MLIGLHQQVLGIGIAMIVLQEHPHAFDELTVELALEEHVPQPDGGSHVFIGVVHALLVVPFGDRLICHEFTMVQVEGLSEQWQDEFFVVELATAP